MHFLKLICSHIPYSKFSITLSHFSDRCARRCISCNTLCTAVSEVHLRVGSLSLMHSVMIESVCVSLHDILYSYIMILINDNQW